MLHVEGFLTAVRAMINAGHRVAQEREGIPTPCVGAKPTLAISAKNWAEGLVIPETEELSVDALALMHDTEQIGFKDFDYKMKGGWDIERCLITRHDPDCSIVATSYNTNLCKGVGDHGLDGNRRYDANGVRRIFTGDSEHTRFDA